MQATVQISLDVLSIDEAVSTAAIPLRAGVDWLEAGTPLIIAEGMHVNVDTRKRRHATFDLAVSST